MRCDPTDRRGRLVHVVALVLTGGALQYPWITIDPGTDELALTGVATVFLGSRLLDASRR